MLKKRQVFKTIVTTENGVAQTYVEETVPETVVVTTTLDASTTTVWTTSALGKHTIMFNERDAHL